MARKIFVRIAAAVLGFSLTGETALPAVSELTPNSADRILFWVGAGEVIALSDAELDLWKSRGVGGFHCMGRQLYQMGGTQRFTGDANADLSGKAFEMQRTLRDSGVVRRAKERGMKLYLGCYVVDYYNTRTPFKEWFDDPGWAQTVIPQMRDFAAAAKLLGFDGITFDQELYGQKGGVSTATWEWDYPGNTHTETEVREKATERGRQLMQAIVEGFPGVEISVYHFEFPETWMDVIQKQVNKIDRIGEGRLFTEFWDGMTSVEGFRAVRFMNAAFYKVPHLGTWETALQYEMNSFHAMASRRFSHWASASSRIYLSPFSWINGNVAGEGAFTAPRPPEYVAAQLAAFKKWGMGREVANFCYGSLNGFDYSPYFPALVSAAAPAVVDAAPPRLEITSPTSEGSYETAQDKLDLAGFAVDNLAIRAVRWKKDNLTGAARMTWQIKSGDYRTGYDWQMNWSAQGIPLGAGSNTIVLEAEDIKGLTATKEIRVTRK